MLGWQRPCYLMADGYATSYKELVETTDWDAYGRGKDPRCANCMAHCGYEPTAVIATHGLAAPVPACPRQHPLTRDRTRSHPHRSSTRSAVERVRRGRGSPADRSRPDLPSTGLSQADVAASTAARPARGRVRRFLVESVAETGGHLGSNLGVVELTLALHRVFDSPSDRIVWDTGHQAYVHKLVTGRADDFAQPPPGRRAVGLPEPGRVRPRPGREQPRLDRALLRLRLGPGPASCAATTGPVVAVVGDGALTGGLAYEASTTSAPPAPPS